MSEKVTLSGDDMLMLIKRAEATGYKKAMDALSSDRFYDEAPSFVSYGIYEAANWLKDNEKKILE